MCRAGKSITPIGQSKPHTSSALKAHRLILPLKKRARSPRKMKRDHRGSPRSATNKVSLGLPDTPFPI